MVNSKFLLFYFFLWTHFLSAQNNYIVYFKDKINSSYSTLNPEAFLSQRALIRREKCRVFIQESDLPVNQNYIQQVQLTGAKIIYH
jgi:serine protease AprX